MRNPPYVPQYDRTAQYFKQYGLNLANPLILPSVGRPDDFQGVSVGIVGDAGSYSHSRNSRNSRTTFCLWSRFTFHASGIPHYLQAYLAI